jgi:hypothetical protein
VLVTEFPESVGGCDRRERVVTRDADERNNDPPAE